MQQCHLTYVGSLATLLWRRVLRERDAEPAVGEFCGWARSPSRPRCWPRPWRCGSCCAHYHDRHGHNACADLASRGYLAGLRGRRQAAAAHRRRDHLLHVAPDEVAEAAAGALGRSRPGPGRHPVERIGAVSGQAQPSCSRRLRLGSGVQPAARQPPAGSSGWWSRRLKMPTSWWQRETATAPGSARRASARRPVSSSTTPPARSCYCGQTGHPGSSRSHHRRHTRQGPGHPHPRPRLHIDADRHKGDGGHRHLRPATGAGRHEAGDRPTSLCLVVGVADRPKSSPRSCGCSSPFHVSRNTRRQTSKKSKHGRQGWMPCTPASQDGSPAPSRASGRWRTCVGS
jgi:hypothetical protein